MTPSARVAVEGVRCSVGRHQPGRGYRSRMSTAQGLSTNQVGPHIREKMRVLLGGSPIGAWAMIEPGSITIDPDTAGRYKAVRTGVIVQHEPGLVVIRRKLLPALFHSHRLVVRGSTPAGVHATVGVQITTGGGSASGRFSRPPVSHSVRSTRSTRPQPNSVASCPSQRDRVPAGCADRARRGRCGCVLV
jgi:hypothetical protein